MKWLFKDKEKESLRCENQKLRRLLSAQKSKTEFETIHMIPIERICLDSVRTENDKTDESFVSLTESIRKYGLIQPIVLKRISLDMSDETGLFTLVSGFRRIKALKLIGEKRAKAIIIPHSMEDISKISFVDNTLRKFYDIFETADIVNGIYGMSGCDFQGTAEALCISKKQLGNLLDLSKLNENEREMCRTYSLSEFQILCLAKIDDEDDRKVSIRHLGSSGLSRRQTEEYFYDIFGLESLTGVSDSVKRKLILKDIRLFYNTIDKTVDSFGECGIPIDYSKEELREGFKITIFIKKKRNVI